MKRLNRIKGNRFIDSKGITYKVVRVDDADYTAPTIAQLNQENDLILKAIQKLKGTLLGIKESISDYKSGKAYESDNQNLAESKKRTQFLKGLFNLY